MFCAPFLAYAHVSCVDDLLRRRIRMADQFDQQLLEAAAVGNRAATSIHVDNLDHSRVQQTPCCDSSR